MSYTYSMERISAQYSFYKIKKRCTAYMELSTPTVIIINHSPTGNGLNELTVNHFYCQSVHLCGIIGAIDFNSFHTPNPIENHQKHIIAIIIAKCCRSCSRFHEVQIDRISRYKSVLCGTLRDTCGCDRRL